METPRDRFASGDEAEAEHIAEMRRRGAANCAAFNGPEGFLCENCGVAQGMHAPRRPDAWRDIRSVRIV